MSTPKAKGDGFVLVFAAVVCVTCSLLLSVAASTLKEKQDYNVELDRKLNVLKAFGVSGNEGTRIAAEDVERYFRENITELMLDGESGLPIEGLASDKADKTKVAEGALLPLYQWKEAGSVTKVAFPVSGKGLWSTIYGYLALEKDLATIAGVTFYRHGETPGLGGEVEKDWFQANFKGKRVFSSEARLPFEVVKGSVADRYPSGNDHAVDGISGATLTGKGVTTFLNRDLDRYEKYFKSIRGT